MGQEYVMAFELSPSPVSIETPAAPVAVARPDRCLNCGAAVETPFCGQCGQQNKHHTISLRPLLSDLFAELISWDSRLIRTIVLLLRRPGFLTTEYNAGRLVPYLSPLKLYLTVSVLFFLLLSWRATMKDKVVVNATGIHLSAGKPEKKVVPDKPLVDGELGQHLLKAQQDGAGLVNSFLGLFPKMMFLLLPLFALNLKILYLRTRRLYVEHLVFLLHVHSFGFLVLCPLAFYHPVWLIGLLYLGLNAYFLVALHTVYGQEWEKTFIKFLLLGSGYTFLLVICTVATIFAALWWL